MTTEQVEIESVTARRKWIALWVVGISHLMVNIDVTVVSVAMPTLQRDLGMSDMTRQWAISAYTLPFGATLLLGGRFADRFGRKRMLITSVLGFAAASAFGGAAGETWMFIVARVAQGTLAGTLAPAALSVLSVSYPAGADRARAFSIFNALIAGGAALGTVLGGTLTEFLDWRWCLYINIPIAVLSTLAAWIVLNVDELRHSVDLDWLGALLSGGGIALIIYSLTDVAAYGWRLPSGVGSLAMGVVLLGSYTVRHVRGHDVLLPRQVIASSARIAAFVAGGAVSFGLYGMLLFVTYYLQTVLSLSALNTGLALVPILAANIVISTFAFRCLRQQVAPRSRMLSGLLFVAIAMFFLGHLTDSASYLVLILPAELLIGAGVGIAMPAVMDTATRRVGLGNAGAASGLVTASQLVGATLGSALFSTIAASVTANGSTGDRAETARGFSVASVWCAAVVALLGIAVLVIGRRKRAKKLTPGL
ncbi:MFS transporter [Amycolatopsis sp.]|uniref:MFS transporter n=1 Tax=Amycolatopsis sp. TaxID=37632 RepID=UPI002BB5D983|nr:MFS transporter [Amycolatopsis sp.]HVV11197.1 MFS transporter [Amycolatopsis sp.]